MPASQSSSALPPHTEISAEALPPPRHPEATQPLHQHRVVGHRVRRIDQVVQPLIIPCGGVSEPGPDGPILCPRTLPPPPLEVEDGPRTLVELSFHRSSGGRVPIEHRENRMTV